jgi:hypothetical protein
MGTGTDYCTLPLPIPCRRVHGYQQVDRNIYIYIYITTYKYILIYLTTTEAEKQALYINASARVQISATLSSGAPEESAQAWQDKPCKLASLAVQYRNFYLISSYKTPKSSLQMIMHVY